ncbi:MAG: three-Cys-motif partner protein TcmP [Melioribacteraceae bacterium]|nr:three-Cys-motif partner protein TcmP [Melioribacteraceae bacterium]MCF8353776.1 three-Cys-motif partner protein TcmP [Melioribacteraceae bacterium]MCF8393612.1 three-Cys-motif partner protein TcmP [Melioribacteraceae bacterium]MCF8419422.1 three-Cys-motif partner protein TcmP [Melioribacteraceae bacterium]
MVDETIFTEDDGLTYPVPIGSWALVKYKVIFDYMTLFSSGMKKIWDNRIYIDLYSAAGKAKIRSTDKIVNTSALLALKVSSPFDKYLFCEKEKKLIDALRERIKNEHPGEKTILVEGDCNENVDKIISEIPTPSKTNTVLCFCFVDPFSLDIKFDTIKKLSRRFTDFLVLLALHMDGRRNVGLYVDKNNTRIDDFLGDTAWRNRWELQQKEGKNFVRFLADEFTKRMVYLGYREEALDNFISIKSDAKNLPLYYLAFYSKHQTGYKFWKTVQQRNNEPGFFD